VLRTILVALACFPAILSAQWIHQYGADEEATQLYLFDICTDGGYIIPGIHRIDGGFEDYDGLVIRTDNQGTVLWQKILGGNLFDQLYSAKQTEDLGFIITGSTRLDDEEDREMWLVKLDQWGEVEWSQAYGGDYENQGYSVLETEDDGFIVAAMQELPVPFLTPHLQVFKTDENGVEQWSQIYFETSNYVGFEMKAVSDGFVIVGTMNISPGNSDIFLVKINNEGEQLWLKNFGDTELGERGFSVHPCENGDLALAGTKPSDSFDPDDFWIIRTDSEGEELWNVTLDNGQDDEGFSIIETSDGGLAVVGVTRDIWNDKGIWLVKLEADGEVEWDQVIAANYDEYGVCIREAADWDLVISGWKSHPSEDVGTYKKGLLIRTDEDGNTESLGVDSLIPFAETHLLKMTNLLGQEVHEAKVGELVIYLFSDGTSEKRLVLPH
jgi:hypothetical protein